MSSQSPALLDAMQYVGKLLQSGDLRAAHDQLQNVVEMQPDYVEALRLLGGIRQSFGDAAGAEALLRKALALDPAWAPTLLTLGELLLQRGHADEAESLLRRASQRLPQAALLLARHYNDRQRPEDALAIVGPLCAAGQLHPELVTQHVAALSALQRQAEAVTFYRRLSEARPDDAAALHALAIALGAANRHTDAERVTQQVLAHGQRSAAVYFTQASSLVAMGEFERAEATLRECLRLEPRHRDAHDHLARLVWMRSADTAQSTAELDRALHAFAGDQALLATKAAVLQGAGDARGAYTCLADAAAHAQATPALLVRAGLAALEFDPAIALGLAQRALQLTPDAGAPRNLLAAALLGTGDAQAALAQCEALLARTPDDQYLIALQTTAWRLLGDARYEAYCDYAQLVCAQTLPTPPAWPNLTAFLADLKHSLERLHQRYDHPLLFQSLRHGTETTGDLAREQDPVIQALFRAFDLPIRHYLAQLGHGDDPLRRRNRGSYRYNGGWSVRLRSAGHHTNHVHPRGWISSAFYIDLPAGMAEAGNDHGCLAFGEPGVLTAPTLHAQHIVRPQAGRLVLFPSYFWHGTVPFRSAQTRLTVAFDVVPA